MTRYFYRESGMTLIEILVTVFVLAVGLLGLAGLQSASIKGVLDVSQRSQALWLVNDLVDRMRANPDGLADYASLNVSACATPATICSDNGSDTNGGAACTPAQVAAFDVWDVACGQATGDNDLANAVDSIDITAINVSCSNCGNLNTAVYTVEMVYTSKLVNSSKVLSAEERGNQESQSITIKMVPTYVATPI